MQIRNSITLIGHVGQNPEILNTKKGDSFLRFSLATNEYWRDQDGNKQSNTEWHTVMVFGNKVNFLKEAVQKGTLLAVQGTLRYRKWVDKHEQNRLTSAIYLSDFALLSPKSTAEPLAAA